MATSARLDTNGVIVSCPSCATSNRLKYENLGKATRCAQCRTNLASLDVPIEAPDSATFSAAMQKCALPMLVDFWAAWCGPCRMVAPELEKVARSNAGRYLVVKVNTEVLKDTAAAFRIQSIPTLALVHGGRELQRVAGAMPAPAIEAFVTKTLADAHVRAS
jgi:thioredoxin 2